MNTPFTGCPPFLVSPPCSLACASRVPLPGKPKQVFKEGCLLRWFPRTAVIKLTQRGWLKITRVYCLTVRRPAVQKQGVFRATLPLKALRENPALRQSLVSLGLWPPCYYLCLYLLFPVSKDDIISRSVVDDISKDPISQ